jgi:hypothetical protein
MVRTHHHSYSISFIIIHPRKVPCHPLRYRLRHPSRTRHRGPIPRHRIHLRLCLPRILGFSPSSRCSGAPPHARHLTVMGSLIPSVAALSKATTFGDAAEACKVGGTKLKANPRRATFVMDMGNPPPDLGAMTFSVFEQGPDGAVAGGEALKFGAGV